MTDSFDVAGQTDYLPWNYQAHLKPGMLLHVLANLVIKLLNHV